MWTWVQSIYVGWEAVGLCTVFCEEVSNVLLCLYRCRARPLFPVLTLKAYRFSISFKTDMSEKGKMVKALREYTSSAPHYDVPPNEEEGDATGLPPLQYIDEQDGWITFEGPILFMYAGKGPFVSR